MSETKKFLMTYEGVKKLEDELEYLKAVKRKEITEKIKVALGYGDLSENSEYDDAKNEQAFIEGRILELEQMISTATVIDSASNKEGVVMLGSTVVVKDMEFGEEETYTIVGTTEADPSKNRISNESPVGAAILGQKVNSVVQVHTPAGELSYQILEVK